MTFNPMAIVMGLLIVLPIFLLAWLRIRSQTGRSRSWIANAEALGLRHERRVMPIVNVAFEAVAGVRDGVRVEVSAAEAHGEPAIQATAFLDPPLRAGLAAASSRTGKPMPGETRPERSVPNVPGWWFRAHDEPLAEALLARLAKTLRRYPRDGRELRLADEYVTVEANIRGTRDEIDDLLDEALSVHANVLAARKRTGPPDWAKAVASSWAEVAEREGLTFEREAMRLHGRTERFAVEIGLELDMTGARRTAITLTLPIPVQGRASLARAGAQMKVLLQLIGEIETPTGDTAFDARFVVHAPSRADADALLVDAVRAALLDLPAEIWGGAIAGNAVNLHADDALGGSSVEALLRGADRLATALQPAAPPGGYRQRA